MNAASMNAAVAAAQRERRFAPAVSRRERRWALLRSLGLLAACVLLSACLGKAAVLKEEAAALSVATKATVTQTREFYTRLGLARQNYFLVSVANDKNCRLENPIYLLPDSGREGGFRCLTPDEADKRRACATDPPGAACPAGGVEKAFPDLQRFTPGDIEKSSALELVSVMSEYQGLLAQIIADEEFDATAKLTALQDRVNGVAGLLNGLGASVTTVDFSKQIGAVGKLANLVKQTVVDWRDLKNLRTLMSGPDNTAFEDALHALAVRYRGIDKPLLDALSRFEIERERKLYNDEAAKLTPEQRLARLRSWVDKATARSTAAAVPDVLGPAFDALLKSHRELHDAVVNNTYTDAQRRKFAQKSLSQLKEWFQAISGLISVF